MVNKLVVLIFCFAMIACANTRKIIDALPLKHSDPLDSIMVADPFLQTITSNKASFKVQIIYTRIDRDAANKPTFTDFTFNMNNQQYFYPASTVKLPVALLALEKLNEMKKAGVDKYTTMVTDSSYAKQQTIYNHPMSEDGRPSVAHYIKQILLVSDNDAFNRLYEFVGQEYINQKLKSKGYNNAEIMHRLSVSMTEDENRHTNAVSFYDTSGNILYSEPAQVNTKPFKLRNDKMGIGFFRGNSLVDEPFDFSKKNRLSLSDLHRIVRAVIFPESVPSKHRFKLTGDDYNFVRKYMSAYTRESRYPGYDTTIYPDAYVKFLLLGAGKQQVPANIRIFNKVGDAYGFLTDAAYIVDFENQLEFMLSATLLCNSDGIFNDDRYDYDNVGFPFMKSLGQSIYRYELSRLRLHKPNLTAFKMQY